MLALSCPKNFSAQSDIVLFGAPDNKTRNLMHNASHAVCDMSETKRQQLRFLPLRKAKIAKIGKISRIQVLPLCAGDVIWSQSLCSTDLLVELRYQGPD